jgi:hypothetical protein
MALCADGKLEPAGATDLGAGDNVICGHISGLAEKLREADDNTYVDLQFIVSFDLTKEELWQAADLYGKLLKHFESWVPFGGKF